MQLRDLYQSIIVDNALCPQYQEPLIDNNVKHITLFNSSCGDRLTLAGVFKHRYLEQISFRASGCIISRASTNMMCNLCNGQSTSRIITLVTDFSKLMTNEPVPNLKSLGDARSLRSISQLPTRIKCAMLPWKAIYQLIYHVRGELNA